MEPPQERRAEDLWSEVSSRLRENLNEATYRTWFASARAGELDESAFVVTVPNEFVRGWVQGHFLDLLQAAVAEALGEERPVTVAVRSVEEHAPGRAREVRRARAQDDLSTKYSFDLFVIGSSNRFAHAAALAVAEAPAQAYNPLFIYGGTGLGKTHLLQAIAAYVRENQDDLTARYVTSETFVNDFINSVRDKRIEGFKQRYRHYDVLLVDDIQFLEGKDRIQEEFFHTFNTLYEADRQIVISSDRPPRDIATLEARLRSRFEWGLITDIQPPDLETRIAILRKKVKTERVDIADPQVLTTIAGRITTNIRELEGALTRVVAFSSLTGRPMTADLTHEVLENVFPQGDVPEISVERIQEMVVERFGISLAELTGHRRSQVIVYPRQIAMYLSRQLTDDSLPKIGKKFGGRDHTTVIHATSKIERLLREDRTVYELVQELTARVKQAR